MGGGWGVGRSTPEGSNRTMSQSPPAHTAAAAAAAAPVAHVSQQVLPGAACAPPTRRWHHTPTTSACSPQPCQALPARLPHHQRRGHRQVVALHKAGDGDGGAAIGHGQLCRGWVGWWGQGNRASGCAIWVGAGECGAGSAGRGGGGLVAAGRRETRGGRRQRWGRRQGWGVGVGGLAPQLALTLTHACRHHSPPPARPRPSHCRGQRRWGGSSPPAG